VIWQPDNVTADMTPPPAYRKYCLPYYAKHGKQLHEAGKRYVVHMDGRLGPLRPWIAQSEFDAVESFSQAGMGGDLSLAEAIAAWPDKVVLPNLPATLCEEPEERIVAVLGRLLEEGGNQRPWMLQISEDIPPSQWQRVLPIVCRVMG
jgi:uroporphyrinogen-III decarboxylase